MEYEILTPVGFKPFSCVRRAFSKNVCELFLTSGKTLTCTLGHRVQLRSGEFVQVRSLMPGDDLAYNQSVVSLRLVDDAMMYDVMDVADVECYVTDNVVSHNCLFLGSSDTLISGSKLQKMVFQEPESQTDDMRVYAKPEKDRNYAVTVDVGEGIGKDYSIISVFDITEVPYRHVAVYRNNLVHPITLSTHIKRIADEYNEAYVVVENNTVGKITAETLYYDFEYENMLTGAIRDSDAEVGSSKNWVGIRTTKKTKMIGCSNLKSMIESDTLITEDFDTIAELASFIKKGTSFQAEDNKTDDIVMSLVLFAWFANQSYFQDVTNVDVRATIRANLAKMEDESHLVFGFYDNGVDESNDLFP